MTGNPNDRFLVRQLIRITEKELTQLLKTADRLQKQPIDHSWIISLETNDDRSEILDAFVSRFGRLQDTLGDKLLPSMLRASLEKTGTQLDNLFLAEKNGMDRIGPSLDRKQGAQESFDSRMHGVCRRSS